MHLDRSSVGVRAVAGQLRSEAVGLIVKNPHFLVFGLTALLGKQMHTNNELLDGNYDPSINVLPITVHLRKRLQVAGI